MSDTHKKIAAVYEVIAHVAMLNAQSDAMKIENEFALRRGSLPPYRDSDFYALARDFAEASARFRDLKKDVPPALAGG